MQFHNQSNRVAPDTALRPGSEKRVSSHLRVQGSLTPTSALGAADLSTLPPKTIMQESTLLSGSTEKSTNILSQNARAQTAQDAGGQERTHMQAGCMPPGPALSLPPFLVIAMAMMVHTELLQGLR